MRQFATLFVSLFLFVYAPWSTADVALVHRPAVQQFIHQMVQRHHFDKRQLETIMREAVYQPQIIESMDKPFEKKTWDVYKDLFLTQARVDAGLQFWRENQKTLERAEHEFGVPASIIVAIIGVETLYGKHQGTYRVLDALTTLAFYYPKRSPYFTKELGEYLLLCREQGVRADLYLGSYAGAMGKPQFMPSSYRFFALDYAGHGKRDLMNDDRDVIGSVANYFHRHGWTMGMNVAQPANVRGGQIKKLVTNSKTPNYTLQSLLSAGVSPVSLPVHPPKKVGLIELETRKGQEYWLAYPNFYVITRYNTSPQYALVVYLFSQRLTRQKSRILM
ncbi:MAG: lytic murein transglycosylase B [Legionellales bacterium]|nr:lytic murein transglycosylase B [Legionellales bacterium]